jgi:tetratricopeptide (TPR) repeat protein
MAAVDQKGRPMKAITLVSMLLAAASVAAPAIAADQRVVGGGTTAICAADVQDVSADAKTGIADCTDALEYQPMSMPDRVATTINRGTLRSRAGDLQNAVRDFSSAIAMDGSNAGAYLNRSATYLGLKNYAAARSDADAAIRLHARPVEVAYYNRGAAEEGLGDTAAAYHDYKAALQMQPNFTAAKNELTRFKVTGGGSDGGAM